MDVFIKEAQELGAITRIYMTSDKFNTIFQNEINVSRTRLLSSEPVRRLKSLSIKIVLAGGIEIASNEYTPDFDLGLTVFSVSNETSVPSWVSQTFVL